MTETTDRSHGHPPTPDGRQNPFWDEMFTWPGEQITYKYDHHWEPDPFPYVHEILAEGAARIPEYEQKHSRMAMAEKYSWSIPSPTSIQFVVDHLNGRPIIDMGAGTGYWAWMLSQEGVDVIAFDANPPILGWNPYHCPKVPSTHVFTDKEKREHRQQWEDLNELERFAAEAAGREPTIHPVEDLPDSTASTKLAGIAGTQYFDVQQGGVEQLAKHPDRELFLSWPPYSESFGYEAIKAYQGEVLIYLGEGNGGCCGDDSMWHLLETEWKEIDDCPNHVSWAMIHDSLRIYRRR